MLYDGIISLVISRHIKYRRKPVSLVDTQQYKFFSGVASSVKMKRQTSCGMVALFTVHVFGLWTLGSNDIMRSEIVITCLTNAKTVM